MNFLGTALSWYLNPQDPRNVLCIGINQSFMPSNVLGLSFWDKSTIGSCIHICRSLLLSQSPCAHSTVFVKITTLGCDGSSFHLIIMGTSYYRTLNEDNFLLGIQTWHSLSARMVTVHPALPFAFSGTFGVL